MSIERYYEILQVSPTATVDEVKRAFRKQAMLLHPDRNNNDDAHEQFLLLTEAYEFIVKNKRVTTTNRHRDYERWQEQERAQARARATEHARMRYEDYINSDYYQSISAIETAVNHLLLFSMYTVMVALPVIATFYYGWIALVVSLLVLVITSPASITAYKDANINLTAFYKAMRYIVSRKKFILFFGCFFNLLIFIYYSFHTLFSTWALILIFVGTTILFWRVLKSRPRWHRNFIALIFVPMLMNLFLVTNFHFSSHPQQQQFQIYYPEDELRSAFDETTTITLVDDELSNYWGVRTFLNYSELKDKNFINYTFKDGFWGIQVVTDYEFK